MTELDKAIATVRHELSLKVDQAEKLYQEGKNCPDSEQLFDQVVECVNRLDKFVESVADISSIYRRSRNELQSN
jgi:hypothetical protein